MASAEEYYQQLYEQHAERIAVEVFVKGFSFTQSIKLRNQYPVISVRDLDKSEDFLIRSSDIFKACKKFLEKTGLIDNLCQLGGNAGILSNQAARWIRTAYTDRYKWIKTKQEVSWLKENCLSAIIHLGTEHKYQRHSFQDGWSEREYGKHTLRVDYLKEAAVAINHSIKNTDQAEELLEQVYLKFCELEKQLPEASYSPLPPLPPGMPDPFTTTEEEPENDE